MIRSYQVITSLLLPLLALYWPWRVVIGKEKLSRVLERYGIRLPKLKPISGPVLWCHAASNGECLSLAALINRWQHRNPSGQVVLTSQTLTSVSIIKAKIPNVIQVMAPIDHWLIWQRFVNKYRPQALVLAESEFWPGMLECCRQNNIKSFLVSGRITDRSFGRWQGWLARDLFKIMMANIATIYPQSTTDHEKFTFLLNQCGMKSKLGSILNLKLTLEDLNSNTSQSSNSAQLNLPKNRPIWLAASTHHGEEGQIIAAAKLILKTMPNILTVIVIRHPRRAQEVAQIVKSHDLKFALRSKNDKVTKDTKVLLVDTVGELINFYGAIPVALVCGSLVPDIGGHNAAEAIAAGCLAMVGPYHHNFTFMTTPLKTQALIDVVAKSDEIAEQVSYWLSNPKLCQARAKAQHSWLTKQQQYHDDVLDKLLQLI